MKKVTVQRTERFVEEAGSAGIPPASVSEPTDDEEWQDCPHCEGKFRAQAFADNEDFCPGCGRDAFGDLKEPLIEDPPRELSEAEILLQSIADDDAYSLRVEKLTNYDVDPRTDSQAVKEYCTTLKPVTLNYLEIVRSAYGGGAYRFSMYKRGQAGVVKWWVEVIAKPIASAPADANASVAPSQSIAPQVDRLRVAVEKAVANRIERILDDEPSANRPPLPPAPPPDENTIVAQAIMARPEVIESVIRRVTDKLGNEGEPWHAPLIREAISNLPKILDVVQAALASSKPNGNGAPLNGTLPPRPVNPGAWRQPEAAGPGQSATPSEIPQPPSPAALAFGRLLRRCAADMCYSTDHRDDDGDLDDVCSADVAVAETLKLVQNFPEYAPQINQVLAAPPAMLVAFVAQQCQDATLLENPGSVLFATDYQNMLREALSEPPAVAGGPVDGREPASEPQVPSPSGRGQGEGAEGLAAGAAQ